MVRGPLCVANGSISFVCTGCISVVHALVVAVPTVALDGANHGLDSKHYSYLLCLASAHTWAAVGGSRLDHVAGIRSRGSSCRHHRFVPAQPPARTPVLSGPGRVSLTPPHRILCPGAFFKVNPTRHLIH